jgi:hypothetical protein
MLCALYPIDSLLRVTPLELPPGRIDVIAPTGAENPSAADGRSAQNGEAPTSSCASGNGLKYFVSEEFI